MSGVRRVVAGMALALTLIVAGAGAAQAADLEPRKIRVGGGEGTWQAENNFRLDWDQPSGGPPVAIHLRLRNASGTVVTPEIRFPSDDNRLERIRVPSGPGRYTAEVWLEGSGGEIGPPVAATLLFDDARPGPTQALAPQGWVAGDAAATVRFTHPSGPFPASGIRGYAVSVDRGSGSSPCARPSWCSPDETDLRGGIGADAISLGPLPEGRHVVRAVAVSGSGVTSAEASSAIVHVDATSPAVELKAPQGWENGPVQVVANATDALSGMAAAGPSGPATTIAIGAAAPRMEPGASATATVSGEGAHRITAYARDAAGNSSDGAALLATVRIDQTPPRVAFANFQDPADPERIEATVSDALSGADPVEGSIAVRPAGSRQRFVPLPTAVSAGRLVARWDSDSFTRGTYEFRASGFDAAGNGASSDRRANGARLVLVNPVKSPTEVVAGFGGRELTWQRCWRRDGRRRCRQQQIRAFESRPTARTVPFGRSVPYSGRLSSASGPGLGGQTIEIVESFAPGSEMARRTTVIRTAADGSFATRLGPGPNRQVEVSFAGSRTLTRAAGGAVSLRVRAGVHLHSSTAAARIGGAPVVFAGKVADAPAGLPVELQFRIPGGEWSEFRTVPTDAHGRFRYRYEFSDDDSRGVRFQFRAYIERGDWPYEPAASAPLFVTGY